MSRLFATGSCPQVPPITNDGLATERLPVAWNAAGLTLHPPLGSATPVTGQPPSFWMKSGATDVSHCPMAAVVTAQVTRSPASARRRATAELVALECIEIWRVVKRSLQSSAFRRVSQEGPSRSIRNRAVALRVGSGLQNPTGDCPAHAPLRMTRSRKPLWAENLHACPLGRIARRIDLMHGGSENAALSPIQAPTPTS